MSKASPLPNDAQAAFVDAILTGAPPAEIDKAMADYRRWRQHQGLPPLGMPEGGGKTPACGALSPALAARYLGIGKTKMWGLITSGRIPSKTLDGRRLIRVADLDAFRARLPS
jgi:excisionase family DNA binding protein